MIHEGHVAIAFRYGFRDLQHDYNRVFLLISGQTGKDRSFSHTLLHYGSLQSRHISQNIHDADQLPTVPVRDLGSILHRQ
jgi:hypothetical protein